MSNPVRVKIPTDEVPLALSNHALAVMVSKMPVSGRFHALVKRPTKGHDDLRVNRNTLGREPIGEAEVWLADKCQKEAFEFLLKYLSSMPIGTRALVETRDSTYVWTKVGPALWSDRQEFTYWLWDEAQTYLLSGLKG